MDKIKSKVHGLWMNVFGATKNSTVGTVNWREVGAAGIVAVVFYFVGGDLQTVLHQLDPNGTVIDSVTSALVAFVVSLLHKSASGTQTKSGDIYIPADHAK